MMLHNTPSGGMKIKEECSLPLTGLKVVSKIITELAVFEVPLFASVIYQSSDLLWIYKG